MDERKMLDILHRRYGETNMRSRRYACAEQIPDATSMKDSHRADFIAFDCWASGLKFYGHEVKVSRSDWLSELKHPWKSEAFKQYMDYWYLVVSSMDVVRMDEIPADWGLMVARGEYVRVVKTAPQLHPKPMPKIFFASFIRAVQKSALEQMMALTSTIGADVTEVCIACNELIRDDEVDVPYCNAKCRNAHPHVRERTDLPAYNRTTNQRIHYVCATRYSPMEKPKTVADALRASRQLTTPSPKG
jgi:hypothetical protein